MNDVLNHNKEKFELLTKYSEKKYGQSKFKDSIFYAHAAASFAWSNHPGSFYSQRLENVLSSIGTNKIEKLSLPYIKIPTNSKINILHVASYLHDTGGHTRALLRWIENTSDFCNNLVVLTLDQIMEPFVKSEFLRLGVKVLLLTRNGKNILNLASSLRAISNKWPDYIILHTHPDDVIPQLAYSYFEGPPVLLFNHADHVFWIGSSISDLVLSIRMNGISLSQERRNTSKNSILPLPLKSRNFTQRKYTKEKLGLDGKEVVVSMASDYKYTPWKEYNFSFFFETFLKNRSNTTLVVVGVTKNGNLKNLQRKFPTRVILVAPTPSIDDFLNSADVYVDSFPLSSLTSSLDVAMRGIPVLGVKNKLIPIFNSDDPAFVNFKNNWSSLEQLSEKIEYFLDNKDIGNEIGLKMQTEVVKAHTGENWNETLRNILKNTKRNTAIAQQFTDRENTYDTEIAEFFSNRMHKEALTYRTYETLKTFSYLHLGASVGSTVENMSKRVRAVKFSK